MAPTAIADQLAASFPSIDALLLVSLRQRIFEFQSQSTMVVNTKCMSYKVQKLSNHRKIKDSSH